MKQILTAMSLVGALALTGCAGLSDTEQRVGSGAIIGGVLGNVIGSGSTAATVGGAVLGGVVGNQVDQNKRNNERDARDNWQRRYDDCRRYNNRRFCDNNVR